MSARRTYLQLQCPHCRATTVCGPEDMLARLRGVGVLRREKDPHPDLVRELFHGTAGRLACARCGQSGLVAGPVSDDFAEDGWEAGRPCEVCGQPIPPERLELLPDTRLCVACQRGTEAGKPSGPADYCPRCGSEMVLNSGGRVGVTRYTLICPECGR